jgi:hypothetical protein
MYANKELKKNKKSPTSGGGSVGIVRSRTHAMKLFVPFLTKTELVKKDRGKF